MGERCITNWYVATSRKEAERLAGIDHTPLDKIKCSPNTEPLCVDWAWSYWSDGKFSGRSFSSENGEPEPEKCPISKDAKMFISGYFGSDGGDVEGGLNSLVTIDEIVSKREEIIGGGGYYAADRIEIYDVRHKDGKKETLYIRTVGYPEGYWFDICRNYKNARKSI